jgi:formate hydrogenlyase subunit 3/multisubunit Na+/H+ antiporter MnhD subunit
MARGGTSDALFTMTLSGGVLTEYTGLATAAFLCILIAAFAKAGVFPLHSWVPDVAEVSPAPISALLLASLDKALGIYLLFRLVTICPFIKGTWLQTLLLTLGSMTIICAAFMTLKQQNMKRLLGYCAVAQVGYMVLGIGTLTTVGIIGGMFHMLNHIIYKTLLFMGAGSVESRTQEDDLTELGGIGRKMPLTFGCMVLGTLAISGVPPLNGFMSKWLVYQGTITLSSESSTWFIWLTAAMFGSALTLAGLVKLIHAVFLANPKHDISSIRESGPFMQLPMLILAAGCIIFGVAAWMIPIKGLLRPALNISTAEFGRFSNFMYMRPFIVTILLLIALAAGFLIYLFSRLNLRRDVPHIGGETFKDDMKISGTDFYQTIADLPVLRTFYRLADNKWFDIYDLGIRITNYITGLLRAAHQGYLYAYVTWCLVGLAVIICLLMIW